MLLQLSIKNFALIEEVTLEFNKGFNILSGETGAGKSILIDAINYVLGSKFNKDLIRTGEEKTFVEAIFSIENSKVTDVLSELDIEYEDIIIISRETFQNGRSIIKVNNKAIIASNLKKISEKLVDIHGQHNNQNLLNRENHINYLDAFGEDQIANLLKDYGAKYDIFKEIENKINNISLEGKNEKLISYLEYQLKEIEEAKLKNGEEEELEERYNLLSNSEKIKLSLETSYGLLSGADEGNSVIDSMSIIIRELSNVDRHSEKIKKIKDNLNNIFYDLQEFSRDIRDLSEDVIYDDNELENINSRIFKISTLKKKYGDSIEEILEYKKSLKKQLNEMLNAEKILEKLQQDKANVIENLENIALDIHEKREQNAIILQENIETELKYIGLEKCRFNVSVEYAEKLNEKGKDIVQFLIATNPGEPLKPMERIVSGGELSRIMLALKTVFIDKDDIPTVIFDEIDTGISGRVAQSVGEKMYQISVNHQVFCITHLTQIVSMSDYHYLVKKEVKDGKTFSTVEFMTEKQKIDEIAKMLGGVKLTEGTILNAKEMNELAFKKKQEIIKNIHNI